MSRMVLVLLAFLVGGCVTPVIPIPPPDPKGTVDVSKQELTVYGEPGNTQPEAMVFLYNQRTGTGLITLAEKDGSYLFEPVVVQDKDRLDVWASRWSEDSPSAIVCMVVNFAKAGIDRCP